MAKETDPAAADAKREVRAAARLARQAEREEWRRAREARRAERQRRWGLPPEPVAEKKIRIPYRSEIYTLLLLIAVVNYAVGIYVIADKTQKLYNAYHVMQPVPEEIESVSGAGGAATPGATPAASPAPATPAATTAPAGGGEGG